MVAPEPGPAVPCKKLRFRARAVQRFWNLVVGQQGTASPCQSPDGDRREYWAEALPRESGPHTVTDEYGEVWGRGVRSCRLQLVGGAGTKVQGWAGRKKAGYERGAGVDWRKWGL